MAIGKNIFFICDGVRLHTALTSFSPTLESEELDTTTLGTSGGFRTYTPGFKSGSLSLEGLWDADTTAQDKIDDVLKAAFSGSTPKQIMTTLGTIAHGALVLMLQDADVVSYNAGKSSVGELIMVDAEVKSDNGVETGKIHYYDSADSAENGASVDNAVATDNGGYFQAHLYLEDDSAATDANFKMQHSDDNSTWVDIAVTDAGIGGDVGANSVEITGTVERYTRVVFEPDDLAYGVAAFARR